MNNTLNSFPPEIVKTDFVANDVIMKSFLSIQIEKKRFPIFC